MGAGPGMKVTAQNRKTLPSRQEKLVERWQGVREKARTDHAVSKTIMQRHNTNAEADCD